MLTNPVEPSASDQPPISPRPRRPENGGLILGVLLVVVGALFLAGEFIQVDVGAYGWPFFVIVPGVILLVLGATVRGGSGLAIPGGIVTMTGLVLLVQNTTGLWASWAYAWALVAPGGVGAGLLVQGVTTGSAGVRAAGIRAIAIAVILFLAGFAFFEGALHIDGQDFGVVGKVALPVLLVSAGLWLLMRNLRSSAPPPRT